MKGKRGWRAVLILLATIVVCSSVTPGQPGAAKRNGPEQLFAYDKSVGFDLKEGSSKEENGVIIRDINYAAYAPRHGRIVAYLLRPKAIGPFAGVIFFHWLGDVKSDRTEFLREATELAREGVVALLIQGYFPWKEDPADGLTDRQQVIDQTVEVRRAFDLVMAEPGVDPQRIGFVGHDYGAMFGAITAGVEKRARAFVLMTAVGGFSDWSLKYWPKTAAKGEDAYRKAIQDVDPIGYVSHGAPGMFFFQFANNDKYISKSAAESFFNAASEPKLIKWYDATHDLNVDAARKDRREWLARQLRLTK